ncbi:MULTISPECIES: DUF6082 family protein [unclassified Streptomyces]|uniref:DUF6082 family protein n=1 Tax=unclassified Streptomyces TaxID=2593676 RepID=UPI002E1789C2
MTTQSQGICRTVVAAAVGGLAGGTATHLWHRFGPGTKWASEERRRLARAHQQRMHWELLRKAIDDPSLASVIDTYDKSIPAEKRRLFLYANLWYTNAFHLYLAGTLDLKELHGHLRELFQNPIMRDYWEASRGQRATLDQKSAEVRIGHMVDQLIKDADEADTDEWWVVGEPPSDA